MCVLRPGPMFRMDLGACETRGAPKWLELSLPTPKRVPSQNVPRPSAHTLIGDWNKEPENMSE